MIGKCQDLALVGRSGTWLFRGQADSSWRLVPTLLRQEPSGRFVNLPEGFTPEQFETHIASSCGSVLRTESTLPDRLVLNEDFVLAFLQHYGVPTRLSDWTRDPLIALYFAASGALRLQRLGPRLLSGKLAVFAMASIYLGMGEAGLRNKLHLVSPAGNANLAAQRGLHVRHDWAEPDLLANTIDRPVSDPAANVSARIETRLIRLDLDWNYTLDALMLLERVGISAATLFPSEYGLARRSEDLALTTPWMDTLLGSTR